MEPNLKKKYSAVKERVKLLLVSQKLADIHFLIGKPPKDQLVSAHKLILSLASPIFEEMFYGSNPVEDDLIEVPDINPEAFKTMLEYIYSDRKKINNIEQAFNVYCVARKYMLQNLMDSSIVFLVSKLKPSNACEAYEFGKSFNEKCLMETSMEIIKTQTMEVLNNPNFVDIAPETLMDILDQEHLNMDSELDLFNAVQKYANIRVYGILRGEGTGIGDTEESQPIEDVSEKIGINIHPIPAKIKMEKDLESSAHTEEDEGMISGGSSFVSTGQNDSNNLSDIGPDNPLESMVFSGTSNENLFNSENILNNTEPTLVNVDHTLTNTIISTNSLETDNYDNNTTGKDDQNSSNSSSNTYYEDLQLNKRTPVSEEVIRKIVKKIRFLTFSAEEFVKGPALSKLLKRDEAFSILINIIEPKIKKCPMPEGFTLY